MESLQKQTYPKWQLCLADGSDKEHEYVGEICREYASKDSRSCYEVLEENKGISENTNECLKFATGDYIGLLDHDDILHESALYEMMKVIEEEKADFLLGNMAFFFVPAGVSIINYFDILKSTVLQLLVICVVSTIVTFAVTAYVVTLTVKLMEKKKGGKKA